MNKLEHSISLSLFLSTKGVRKKRCARHARRLRQTIPYHAGYPGKREEGRENPDTARFLLKKWKKKTNQKVRSAGTGELCASNRVNMQCPRHDKGDALQRVELWAIRCLPTGQNRGFECQDRKGFFFLARQNKLKPLSQRRGISRGV